MNDYAPPFTSVPRASPALCRAAVILALLAARLSAETVRTEMIATNLTENSQPVSLEMVIHLPDGPGPFPVVMFNHGSTGTGMNTSLFTQTWTHPTAARFFTDRGWMVVFPQRRGRGQSGGVYAEGLASNGSGYSCNPAVSLPGLERALTDLDEVVRHLRARTDVDDRRMLIAGQSRGGILSIVHAGTRPGVFLGAINFVGGWMSDQCPNPTAINTASFARGGGFTGPTVWLYGENDPFYGLTHSRANYSAFTAAGGRGEFNLYHLGSGVSGHLVISFPGRWGPEVERLLSLLSGTAPKP